MCGIVACYSRRPIDKDVVAQMTVSLRHRGPDAQDVYIHEGERIALGHTRLSVIDLSVAANQPLYSEDGRFVIVFNGEIYNYRVLRRELENSHKISFRTNSDTEVILAGFSVWGTAVAARLEGMFAFIIVDQSIEKIYAFRDRLGKKPLYCYQSDELVAFASEIKSLRRHPMITRDVMNTRAVGRFLHLGFIPAPETIYQHISKFPAGHHAVVTSDLKLEQISPFWKPESLRATPRITNYDEAKRELKDLLMDATSKRLISDVALGAFLSGGTDSSLVSAMAASISGSLKTFSIGFEQAKFDESKYAMDVAAALNTTHQSYTLREQEAIDLVPLYLKHFDEPFSDTSAIPTMLVSRLARKEVTVALTGDGGDELFQGYGAYSWAQRLDNPVWDRSRGSLSRILKAAPGSRLRRISELLTPERYSLRSHIFSQEQYLFSQREVEDEVLRQRDAFVPFSYDDQVFNNDDFTPGEKQALFDLRYYLCDDLLVKVDRASMYYGLECRSPLLDHRLVEFAFRLNPEFKRHGKFSKIILKDLLKSFLPAHLVDRPKWGFSVPLSRWMKGGLRDMVMAYTDPEIISEAGLVNVDYCEALKKRYFGGMDYLYNRIWAIVALHAWWKDNV